MMMKRSGSIAATQAVVVLRYREPTQGLHLLVGFNMRYDSAATNNRGWSRRVRGCGGEECKEAEQEEEGIIRIVMRVHCEEIWVN